MSDEALRRLERSAAYGGREDRLRYALELERRGRLADAVAFLAPWTVTGASAIAAWGETLERPLRPAVRAEAAFLLATLGHEAQARELARTAVEGARSGRGLLERGWPRARAAAALARVGDRQTADAELAAVLAGVREGTATGEDALLLGRWFVALADARGAASAGDPLVEAGLAQLAALRPARQGTALDIAASALVRLGVAPKVHALALRLLEEALARDLDQARRSLATLERLGRKPDAELGGKILTAIERRAGDADDHVGPPLALAGLRPLARAPRVARELAARLVAAEEHEAAASVRLAALALEAELPDESGERKADAADRLDVELRWAWERVEQDALDVHVDLVLALGPRVLEPDHARELLDEAVERAELIPVAGRARLLAHVFEIAASLPRTLDTEDALERWAEATLASARRTWPVLRAVVAALDTVHQLGAPVSLLPFVERATAVAERALELAPEVAPERGSPGSWELACAALVAAARAFIAGGRRTLAAPLVRRALGSASRIRIDTRGSPERLPTVVRSLVAQGLGVAGDLAGEERQALATEVLGLAGQMPWLVRGGRPLDGVAALEDELLAPAARLVTEDPALVEMRAWRGRES